MDYHVVFFVVKFINFYHVVFHVASCSMEIHMVNHEVGLRCRLSLVDDCIMHKADSQALACATAQSIVNDPNTTKFC